MNIRIIFLGFSFLFSRFKGLTALGGECTDLHHRTIAPGLHYVPGPDSCTLCVCEDGNPKWCKAVLCSPPQDCKSFRVGNSCCDFICLDDTLPKHDGTGPDINIDFGLRLIVSAGIAILLLSLLFFFIHQLRQRKLRGRQSRQLSEDERSIGYITGSLAYLPDNMGYLTGGNQERHLDFPYDEPSSHYPLWKPPGNYFPRGEAPPPYEEAVAAARAEAALAAALASNATVHASGPVTGHRTIPLNLATSGTFHMEPSQPAPARPSRHRADHADDARRISRIMVDIPPPLPEALAAIRSDAYYEDVLVGLPSSDVDSFDPCLNRVASRRSINVSNIPPPEIPAHATATAPSVISSPPAFSNVENACAAGPVPPLNDLNKSSLACSYPCLTASDDNDDYRSECENCKSAHGSSYYVDEEDATSPQETMTLHRRPQDYDSAAAAAAEQAYYQTSLTLPINTRRLRPVPLHGTASSLHGARENWFSSMPASSTSSSEEE